MTDLRKAVEMALKDLTRLCHAQACDTVEALRQALAQPEQEPYDQTALEICEKCGWKAIIPDEGCLVCARNEQEPVAWMYTSHYKGNEWFITRYQSELTTYKADKVQPLYTAPPKREWVGLTRRELDIATLGLEDLSDCYKAIEAKLKEKNT